MKAHLASSIDDRHGDLAQKGDVTMLQLDTQGTLVDALQETRPQSAMEWNCAGSCTSGKVLPITSRSKVSESDWAS